MQVTVDTSVLMAVVLDEPNRKRAIAATRGKTLIAPGSLPWEFGNALSALAKRGLLTAERVGEAVETFHRIPVQLKEVKLERALPLAIQARVYAYDAYMLQCARQFDSPLLTFDGPMQVHARELGIELLDEEES